MRLLLRAEDVLVRHDLVELIRRLNLIVDVLIDGDEWRLVPVSYTHLTLPTILRV